MKVTIPRTIKLEIVKINCNLFSFLMGSRKAIFFAITPTTNTSKIKATTKPGTKLPQAAQTLNCYVTADCTGSFLTPSLSTLS